MRLFELLNEAPPVVKYHRQSPTTSVSDRLPQVTGGKTAQGSQTLGSGVFATVYGHDDNPHEVVKVSDPADAKNIDGYEPFIRELSRDPSMHENPHFPRIQIVRNIYDPRANNNRQYIVRMEKLYSWDKLSAEEFEVMVTNTFKHSYIINIISGLPSWVEADKWKRLYFEWLDKGFISSNYIHERAYTALKLPELQQALSKIAKIADNERVRIDIHTNNIMFRKTQYGPVLVITDPLSGRQY